jgi:putative hydrolase of the HAD superfamily
MIKAVLFDLDDTLYPEMDFVASGFRAVAQHLKSLGVDPAQAEARLQALLAARGRGRIFNDILEEFGLYSEERVKTLLFLYRSHRPTLRLPEATRAVLDNLKGQGLKLGVITDGAAVMQKNKIEALGLEAWMKVMIPTDILGTSCWKPSMVPYQMALELLELSGPEVIYVGDNVTKDCLGANRVGLTTVQLLHLEGSAAQERRPEYQAHHPIKSLAELLTLLPTL